MRNFFFNSRLGIWFKVLMIQLKNAEKKVKIGQGCNIGAHTAFEGGNAISDGVEFSGRIGYGSYIGRKSTMSAKIGRYTCIGPGVQIIYGNHPTDGFASVHPAFFSTAKQAGFTFVKENKFSENNDITVIGNDVWVGANALILGGVHIGDGAVIAMGAVVTGDVAPYTIVGGVPAKKIKDRFPEEISEKLLKIRWWDWDPETLAARADELADVGQFVEKYERKEK